MNWKDKIPGHGLIFEEGSPAPIEQDEPAVVPPLVQRPNPSLGLGVPGSVVNLGSDTSDVERIYRGILTHTDLSGFPTLKKIMETAESIKSVIPDSALRMKTAIAACQGVTREDIMRDLKALSSALATEVSAARQAFVDAGEQNGRAVALVQKMEDEFQAKIAAEKDRIEGLRSDALKAGKRIATEAQAFEVAYQRRLNEIGTLQKEMETYVTNTDHPKL